jgi:hypothetical protein
VELSKSVKDDQYFIQNASGVKDGVSDNISKGGGKAGVREKDGSVIEYMEPPSARKSDISGLKEASDDIEMRAGQSQGPVFGRDINGPFTRHGTE